MHKCMFCLLLLLFNDRLVLTYHHVYTYEFMMPDINYRRSESNICAAAKIRGDFYLVGFEPAPALHSAHHMLLLGCKEPASNEAVWDCSKGMGPCRNGTQVLYVWSRDSPGLHLPHDVGFHVGYKSSMPYLVLQVHYLRKGTLDNSGILLMYTEEIMPHEAGVIVIGANRGFIPPKAVEHIESACTMLEDKKIHPFAYRIHTHTLGTVVAGYVVRQGEQADDWTLLGKRNPQITQGFYPVTDNAIIKYGDVIAARCTINNTKNHRVLIGRTSKHEMCHFYLMYWVENNTAMDKKFCFSAGPPYYYWRTHAIERFEHIPEKDASTL